MCLGLGTFCILEPGAVYGAVIYRFLALDLCCALRDLLGHSTHAWHTLLRSWVGWSGVCVVGAASGRHHPPHVRAYRLV